MRRVSQARIPTQYGEFTAHVFESLLDGTEHLAFVRGEVAGAAERARARALGVPHRRRVRIAALRLRAAARPGAGERSPTTATASSSTCAATKAAASGSATSCARITLQDEGRDTVEANLELGFPADSREYGIGAQILVDLGVTTMRLMTNNPAKYGGIDGYGLEIVERVPLQTVPTDENIAYLRAKQSKLGHLLEHRDDRRAGWGVDGRVRRARRRPRRDRDAIRDRRGAVQPAT